MTSKSSTTTELEERSGVPLGDRLPPVHPGEILLEEFLKPYGMSQYRLAHELKVPPRRINEIVLGKRSVTADTALRLSRFFGLSPQFWLAIQARYDIDSAEDTIGDRIRSEVTPMAAAS